MTCEGRSLVDEALLFHMLPEQRSSLGGERAHPRLNFNWPEKLIALGGNNNDANIVKDNRCCWFLQARTSTWELLAQLPRPNWRYYSACMVKNGILLSGGLQNVAKTESWLFDTVEKRWVVLGNMAIRRYNHSSVALGDDVYVIGGRNECVLSSVESMDLHTRAWQAAPALPEPLSRPLSAVCGHMLIVTGGTRGDGSNNTATITYDATWKTWKKVTDMPQACPDASVAVLTGHLFVVGGLKPVCLEYNPVLDCWNTLEPPQHPHSFGAAVAWRGTILLAGGNLMSGQPTTIIEQLKLKKQKIVYDTSIIECSHRNNSSLSLTFEKDKTIDEDVKETPDQCEVLCELEGSENRNCPDKMGEVDQTTDNDRQDIQHIHDERDLEPEISPHKDSEHLPDGAEIPQCDGDGDGKDGSESPKSGGDRKDGCGSLCEDTSVDDNYSAKISDVPPQCEPDKMKDERNNVPDREDMWHLAHSGAAIDTEQTTQCGVRANTVSPDVAVNGDANNSAKGSDMYLSKWDVFPIALHQPLQAHTLLVVDVCGL